MVVLKNALMCIKKVKLINHDFLPILMLLYIMLAYLMLLAALFNAVCLYNAFFLLLIFENAFRFNALSWCACTSGRCNRQSEFTLLHFTIFH